MSKRKVRLKNGDDGGQYLTVQHCSQSFKHFNSFIWIDLPFVVLAKVFSNF